jgi:GNAT superfamily N-acetyltransferase
MLVIRKANASDAPLIVDMIRELAEFERELDQVEATPGDVLRDGFGASPRFSAFIAEWEGQPAGYALYFFTYSTWEGRPGLFVEDLFVRAQFRRKGIGKSLLQRMAVVAREQNCYGMRWEVLNWNTSAIDFYRSLGAAVKNNWLPVALTGEAFEEFASPSSTPGGNLADLKSASEHQ